MLFAPFTTREQHWPQSFSLRERSETALSICFDKPVLSFCSRQGSSKPLWGTDVNLGIHNSRPSSPLSHAVSPNKVEGSSDELMGGGGNWSVIIGIPAPFRAALTSPVPTTHKCCHFSFYFIIFFLPPPLPRAVAPWTEAVCLCVCLS